MPIKPDLPFPKSAGDAIRSKDWNDLITETQRLDKDKVDRKGDVISGPLTVEGGLVFEGAVPHMDRDGALYRDTNGKCCLTVNEGLFLRKANTSREAILFDVNDGTLFLSRVQDLHGQNLSNIIRFGAGGDYQVLHKNSGHFGRNTLALNCDAADAIGVYSTGMKPLLEVEGGSGNAFVKGRLTTGGDLEVNGNLNVSGRARDQKIRQSTYNSDTVSASISGGIFPDFSADFVGIPNMSIVINAAIDAHFQISAHIRGVHATEKMIGLDTTSTSVDTPFQLVLDGTQILDVNKGRDGITLSRLIFLAAGSHTIAVQWGASPLPMFTTKMTCTARQLQVVEL